MGKNPTLRKQLGKRVKTLRESRSLTQAKLAEKVNSGLTTVGKLEIGLSFPTPETLERIAKVLKVPVFELFRFHDAEDAPASKQDTVGQINALLKGEPEKHRRIVLEATKQMLKAINS